MKVHVNIIVASLDTVSQEVAQGHDDRLSKDDA